MGEISILCTDGYHKIIWDPENEAEVEVAKMSFEKLINEEKYTAYKVDKKGEPAKKAKKFNPKWGKLIMVPPIAGG